MKQSDERLIDLYLDMLAAERGAAANTLEAYRRDLEDFSSDLADRGRVIASAEAEDIRGYLGRLSGRGFSAASVARRLSAIRQLYRFLYAESIREDDPAAAIEGPKRGRPLPKVLSIGHVDQLLATAREGIEDAARPIGERLRAARLNCLLEVLYATGLRVSELVSLPASASRRDERMLIVRGKGNKERLVPLNESAKRAMRDYMALREDAEADKTKGSLKTSKWLFPSFGESGHLTRQHFARDLKALAAEAGL